MSFIKKRHIFILKDRIQNKEIINNDHISKKQYTQGGPQCKLVC
jgi:hypothetical protein